MKSMKTNTTFLALAAMALALGACASRGRQISYERDEYGAPSSTSVSYDSTRVLRADDGVTMRSVQTVDYARRSEYQSSLSERLDGISREIDSLYAAAAPGTACERRMGYLQALRDSLRDKLAELPNVSQDQFETKYLDLEDRYTVIQRFLENDRMACNADR